MKMKDGNSHTLPNVHADLDTAEAALDVAEALVATNIANATLIETFANAVRSCLLLLAGDYVNQTAGLATGSTATAVAHNEIDFVINGKGYHAEADAVGVALDGTDTTPQNQYTAFRFQIGLNGTVDCVKTADPTTGYASAVLALAALPALASDHASLGTLTVMSSDGGGFVAGTTEISTGAVTEVYADTDTLLETVTDAIPSALSLS